MVAEPAAAGTRYRLLETIRQYAAERLAETGEAGQARLRHAEAFLRLAEGKANWRCWPASRTTSAPPWTVTLSAGSPAGPRLAGALGGFWLARGLFQEARGWLERALAAGPADPRLRADLHRLLGAVLYAAGDLDRAQAALAQGVQVAAEAGLSSAQARIRVLQADIQVSQGGALADAFQACDAAAAVLESYGDLEGAAEAWVVVGKLRFGGCGGAVAAEEALQRAAACARQSGNHHVERESGAWLAANLQDLPIPADAAAGRAEQLLEAAAGDPWAEAAILTPLALLYGFAGRFADARAAIRRAQSILTGSGAKFDWATSAMLAGQIELMAGDPAAAERNLRKGYEAFRVMGERGLRATIASLLAEAAYAQGRFDRALRLTEDAEALAGADDIETQGRWRATRAKLLARDGQFPAAVRLAEEAVALVPAMIYALAEFLVAKAEVSQQAGDLGEAEESLRRALQFYQRRRALPLADRTRALLASLGVQRAARA